MPPWLRRYLDDVNKIEYLYLYRFSSKKEKTMATKERYINLFTDYGFKKIFGE